MGVTNSTDVFIIGGGPAGLVAAIAARKRGFHVVVADGAQLPFDKACGEGLMPAAVASLGRLGVVIPETDSMPFRGIRFISNNAVIEAGFRGAAGIGVRRTTLHCILASHAESVGVKVLYETPVNQFTSSTATINGTTIHFRYLIGADGSASIVGRRCGLNREEVSDRRFGFRQHFEIAPWTDRVEVYWAEGCQVYVTPVASDKVGVAVLSHNSKSRLQQALPLFPALEARLQGAAAVTAEQGAVTVSRRLTRVTNGRIALIGDASGSVDAITGDGLSIAFLQAEALALALHADDLSLYEKDHGRILFAPAMMSRLLLTMDRHEMVRRRVFSAFSSHPGLFTNVLAMHTGAASPQMTALSVASLGWGLLIG